MPKGLQDEILRLHVRSRTRWTPGARVAVERLVASVELRPSGLPPASVLLIRRIGDLRPLNIQNRQPDAWDRDIQRHVEQRYRAAVQPARDGLSDSAEAVLFTDEAEMLACLLRVIARGIARSCWWSVALLRKFRFPDARPLVVLAHHARHIPAVMAQLAASGDASLIVSSATGREMADCLSALTAEHGLNAGIVSAMHHAAAIGADPPGVVLPELEVVGGIKSLHFDSSERTAGSPPVADAPAPWQQILPQIASAGLAPAAELFLGTAVSLHQAPSRTRSPLFVRQAARWIDSLRHRISRDNQAPPLAFGKQEITRSSLPATDGTVHGTRTTELAHYAAAAARKPEKTNQPRAAAPPPPPPLPAIERTQQPDGAPTKAAQAAIEESAAAVATSPDALADGLETEFGGLLYLVNLMERLDLPDCFEDTWGLASQVGSWGVLELIGRALLDPLPLRFGNDPIWQALAQLDGRTDGLPGTGFRDPDSYRIPPAWLEHQDTLHEVRGDHVRLWSAAGYVIADDPCGLTATDCGDDLSTRFEYGLPGLEQAGVSSGLLRWLCCAMTFIRYRLADALGHGFAETLLQVRGRVFITRTHIDLVTGIDSASVNVRASGLDFDPGWSPRMGRIILFHFG